MVKQASPSPDTEAPYRQGTTATRVRSSRSRFIDTILLLLFPGDPLARAASMVGRSYTGVFCAASFLYFGAVVSFASAQSVPYAVFYFVDRGPSIVIGWGLTAIGPLLSLVVLGVLWLLRYLATHEDVGLDRPLSTKSVVLLITHILLQFGLFALTMMLRNQLLTHVADDASGDCWSVCAWCCPSCAMSNTLHNARQAQRGEARNPDELPPYPA